MTDDPFADFNSGVERARDDYEARPNRACEYPGCPNLARGTRALCAGHRQVGAWGE